MMSSLAPVDYTNSGRNAVVPTAKVAQALSRKCYVWVSAGADGALPRRWVTCLTLCGASPLLSKQRPALAGFPRLYLKPQSLR